MRLNAEIIGQQNESGLKVHRERFGQLSGQLGNAESIVDRIRNFQVAIPS